MSLGTFGNEVIFRVLVQHKDRMVTRRCREPSPYQTYHVLADSRQTAYHKLTQHFMHTLKFTNHQMNSAGIIESTVLEVVQ